MNYVKKPIVGSTLGGLALCGIAALGILAQSGCGASSSKPPALEATVVGNGVISGRVLLEGTPPEEQQLPLDPTCAASCKEHYGEGSRYTRVFVSKDGGLGDVLVTLVGVPAQPIPSGAKELVIDQRGCEYTPYVAACQVGQTIRVTNLDPLLHNVHTIPKVSGNKEVNRSQAANAKPLEFVYDKPEEFLQFKCDVHPWMFSYVSVVEHPFFDVTAEDGRFEIGGLPDGNYQIKFKHRKAGEVTRDIEVKDGQASVEVTLQVPAE